MIKSRSKNSNNKRLTKEFCGSIFTIAFERYNLERCDKAKVLL